MDLRNFKMRVQAIGGGAASLSASRYSLGMFAVFVCVGLVIAYKAVGSIGTYTNFFLLYAALFGLLCSIVATAVNALAPGLPSGSRAMRVWIAWIAIAIPGVLAIPRVEAIADAYAYIPSGTVTAAVGMSIDDIERASTAPITGHGHSYEARLRGGHVAALHIANTPTTIARCHLLRLVTSGADGHVAAIHARIAQVYGPYADAAVPLAKLRTQLLADGWQRGPGDAYVTRGALAISLAPKRVEMVKDDEHLPGRWVADIVITGKDAI